jgi:hypothetical protein
MPSISLHNLPHGGTGTSTLPPPAASMVSAPTALGAVTPVLRRDEAADHGRPDGGRNGGDFAGSPQGSSSLLESPGRPHSSCPVPRSPTAYSSATRACGKRRSEQSGSRPPANGGFLRYGLLPRAVFFDDFPHRGFQLTARSLRSGQSDRLAGFAVGGVTHQEVVSDECANARWGFDAVI